MLVGRRFFLIVQGRSTSFDEEEAAEGMRLFTVDSIIAKEEIVVLGCRHFLSSSFIVCNHLRTKRVKENRRPPPPRAAIDRFA